MRQFLQDARASSFLLVFGVTLALILVVRYPFTHFFAIDPYYHLSQARGYAAHTEITYPELTYFSTYPADPWFGYHYLIAAGFKGADVSDPSALIERSILVHSVLSSILVAALIMMGVSYYRTVMPVYEHRLNVWQVPRRIPSVSDARLVVLLFGIYLFVSMSFVYRALLLERPHVLMITFVMMGLWSVIRQRYWFLPILASLAALSYSMALFIFIPALVLIVGWGIIDRSWSGLRTALVPLWYTGTGFVVGVALHPGAIGYLVNGIGFHAFAILQSLFWWLPSVYALPTPGEMGYQTESMIAVVVPVIVVLGAFWFIVRYGRRHFSVAETQNHAVRFEAGFTTMAVFFSVATLLIQRAIEYAVPFLGAACLTIVVGLVWSLAVHLHRHLLHEFPDPRSFYQTGLVIVKRLLQKKIVRYGFWGFVLTYVIAFSVFVYQLEPVVSTTDRLADTVGALSTESGVGLVMLSTFSLYPQAVFYGPTYHYASGMDPRMTFFYDVATSAALDQFLGQGTRCYTTCHNQDIVATKAFLERVGATHLIVDNHYLLENQITYITEQPFLELVYQSEVYPDVRLYRVLEE